MSVLSPEDHEFFRKNGYVVVRQAVPLENCQAVIDTLFEFLGMDPHNPEDWYHEPHRPNGMVEMYQHQTLWDNRQNPRLYQAFAELLGNERLWVSFDRANFKPPPHPLHPEYDFTGFIHWDTDTTRLPQPLRVQGVLYLSDTAEDQGGFQCVPEIYANLEEWISRQPADREPHRPALNGEKVVVVPGKAGDLLIWNTLLPHGNGHNTSNKSRFAQYIFMNPGRFDDTETREYRIACWRDRLPPRGKPF